MSGFQDVRDVMDIPYSFDTIPRATVKKQKTTEKRPDGITRELFALLGQNAPPVTIIENKFKEKPKWMGKANPWVWKRFQSNTRVDNLTLYHWERKCDTTNDRNKFSRFDIALDILKYTDEEYESFQDKDWSRGETDYLFQLCRDFDLRFPIIWDRYDFPKAPARSLEDLKAKYYSTCRRIVEARTFGHQLSPEETITLNLMNFDKGREIDRKKLAELQFSRTPAQTKEEETLLTELKRLFSEQERIYEDRKELFQRLQFQGTTSSIGAYTGSQGLAHLRDMMVSGAEKSKKRKSIAISQGGSDASYVGTPQEKLGNAAHREAQTVKKQVRQLVDEEKMVYGVSLHDKLPGGVRLRSTMISTNAKGTGTQKINTALAQLGLASRLSIPTSRTNMKYEQLQSCVNTLLEARKHFEKLEQEGRILKAQGELREVSL